MTLSGMIADLIERLLRTETLVTIFALVMYLTGRVETLDQAMALATVTAPLVLGRSAVKAFGKDSTLPPPPPENPAP